MDYVWHKLGVKRSVLTETITGLIERWIRHRDYKTPPTTVEQDEQLKASGTLQGFYLTMSLGQWEREVDSLIRLYLAGGLDRELLNAHIEPAHALSFVKLVLESGDQVGVHYEKFGSGGSQTYLEQIQQKQKPLTDIEVSRIQQKLLRLYQRPFGGFDNYIAIGLQGYALAFERPRILISDVEKYWAKRAEKATLPSSEGAAPALNWVLSQEIPLPSWVPPTITGGLILGKTLAPVAINPFLIGLGLITSGVLLGEAEGGETDADSKALVPYGSGSVSIATAASAAIPIAGLVASGLVFAGVLPAGAVGIEVIQLLGSSLVLADALKQILKAFNGTYVPGVGTIDFGNIGLDLKAEERPFFSLSRGGEQPDLVLLTEGDAIRLSVLSLYVQQFPQLVSTVGLVPALVTVLQTAFRTIKVVTSRALGAPLDVPGSGETSNALEIVEGTVNYVTSSIEIVLALEILGKGVAGIGTGIPGAIQTTLWVSSLLSLTAPSLDRYGLSLQLAGVYGLSAASLAYWGSGVLAHRIVSTATQVFPPIRAVIGKLGAQAASLGAAYGPPLLQKLAFPAVVGAGAWAWSQGWIDLPFKTKLAAGAGAALWGFLSLRQLLPPEKRRKRKPKPSAPTHAPPAAPSAPPSAPSQPPAKQEFVFTVNVAPAPAAAAAPPVKKKRRVSAI